MATDFTKPVVTDNYATLLPEIVTAQNDLARQLDPTLTGTSTNIPTGAKRFNETTSQWERYNGSVWSAFVINGTTLTNTIAPQTHAATSKVTPDDADELPITDSVSSFSLKKLTWVNLKATAKTYFDTLYQAVGTYVTPTTLNAGTLPASLTSITDSGNLTFTGTGNRITGDFSNATVTNRVMFQTSTPNTYTVVRAIPSGTGNYAEVGGGNNSDPNAAHQTAYLSISNTEARLASSAANAGTYLPMTFYTGGSEKMRIDTSGNVGVGGTSTGSRLESIGSINNSATVGGLDVASISIKNTSSAALQIKASTNYLLTDGSGTYGKASVYGLYSNYNGSGDIGTSLGFATQTNAAGGPVERMRIDTSGNVLVIGSGGLGYGTGSGGTVTQATSKSTAVTLNKPTGRITTTADALAAGASIGFQVNNSIVLPTDVVVVTGFWSLIAPQNYRIEATYVGTTGQFGIRITNITAGSLSEALVINYSIIRGATS